MDLSSVIASWQTKLLQLKSLHQGLRPKFVGGRGSGRCVSGEADGIMASMSVDEIRVKVRQNLRFGAEC